MANLFAYLLVRTDMTSLGRGKAHAHSMHAGNQMTWREVVLPMRDGKEVNAEVLAWHEQANGFGTTAALGNANEITLDRMKAVVGTAKAMGFVADLVIDPTYPFLVEDELVPLMDPSKFTMPPVYGPKGFKVCFREEVTTAYVFGDKEPLKILLGQFGLVPND